MWTNIFLYFVLPVIGVLWILRLKTVQNLLEPIRHKLYSKHHHHLLKSHGNHEGKEKAKSILFKDLKTTISKVKDLKDKNIIRILEIGVGTGSNFKYFPDKCQFIGVDPNTDFKQDAMASLEKYPGIQLEKFLHSGGEDMCSIENESVDVVVTTTVLCSVKDLQKCFKEIRRVLVPGGKYYYMEHIAEEHNSKKYWLQKIVSTFITIISYTGIIHAGHLDRKIDQEVLKAGFSSVDQKYTRFEYEGSYMLKLAERHALGVAVK